MKNASYHRSYRPEVHRVGVVVALLALLVTTVVPRADAASHTSVVQVQTWRTAQASAAATATGCGFASNPIACENALIGTPSSQWDVPGLGDDSIQGFATDISVNVGSTVSFKVKTSRSYTVDVYRLGYYQGHGARKVASVTPVARNQPACLRDVAKLLNDCGNWAVSATWQVPLDAVSGVFIARFTSTFDGAASHAPFIVRNDASTSKILMQTSDTTWHAYSEYGGNSLYAGEEGRGYAVSYNRPVATHGQNALFAYEYPMIRFLEKHGYDVSYTSGVDTDRRGSLIKQHKVFLTAGHDEYWSGPQRANVEAARDAGVHLAFFAGNDMYWKTRWESSIDGSGTKYRTMVCYKESWDGAKTDPSAEWTGTWRDPRFSPPSNGGRPENGLVGTAYTVNLIDAAIKVPEADGKMRLWRDTSVATLAPGTTATLAPHTLGYESNEDLDNGFRPAGLFRLSTTTAPTPEYLQDFGRYVAPGTTTHHLTMYRAASGALVFSAGTIQWSWGLDSAHDGDEVTPDKRMRQATVNLLADMGVRPTTLTDGLVAATASTDGTPPTSIITSPVPGTSIPNGKKVTVSGNAVDTGGMVAGVEVSTDGGATWHPATGRVSWTYSFIANNRGPVTIKSRAVDDSGRLETPGAGVGVTMTCPCSLFGDTVPRVAAANDTSDLTLGVRVVPTVDGVITGVRFYKAVENTGTHTGTLWSATGTVLSSGTFTNETASGWQTLKFAKPVPVTAGTTYIASYRAPKGRYSVAANFFYPAAVTAGPLSSPRNNGTVENGLFGSGDNFPTRSFNASNYFVDAVWQTPESVGPSVMAKTPTSGAASVEGNVRPTATFDVPVQPSTIRMSLTSGSTSFAGAVSYDSTTQTATFTPSAELPGATTFTVSVSGARNTYGTPMEGAVTWKFTTAAAGVCPCSLFRDSDRPEVADSGDNSSVEVGVRVRPQVNGKITGIRFYKSAANTGTHVGTLRSASGATLASGTFAEETQTGWQTMTFATPVAVTAGTVYVASYYAPKGHYSQSSEFFADDYTRGDMTAPAAGGNGVYTYAVGGGNPTNSHRATNYWVDVTWEPSPSTAAPTVTAVTPADGGQYLPVTTRVTAKFDLAVQPSTIVFKVKAPNGTSVAGTSSYDSESRTVTFTPTSNLAADTRYDVSVSDARSRQNVAMTAPKTWSFTTEGPSPGSCPCSLFGDASVPAEVDAGDGSAIEVGVKITPSADGAITAIRFYKSSANTGTHVGSLWTATGTRLAKVTYTGETASGWQTAALTTPVLVTAGTTYVASYYAPVGHYSRTRDFFAADYVRGPLKAPAGDNGVFRYGSGGGFPTTSYQSADYGVDVVLKSTVAPKVTSTDPAASATSVPVTSTVSATFAKPVLGDSVSWKLTAPDGTTVTGERSYDETARTSSFIPATRLAASTTYQAVVSGARSTAGVPMTNPVTFSFTTGEAGACPCTLLDPSQPPQVVDSGDSSAIELGVRFTPSVNGVITGVRFYKSAANTGTHRGTLWSSSGVALASGTFAAESASGWQTLTFSTPVAVTAGTTYVASYHAPVGRYSYTSDFFTSDYVNGPLSAPSGENGVYVYGTGGGFPTSSYRSANYFVDVVFRRS